MAATARPMGLSRSFRSLNASPKTKIRLSFLKAGSFVLLATRPLLLSLIHICKPSQSGLYPVSHSPGEPYPRNRSNQHLLLTCFRWTLSLSPNASWHKLTNATDGNRLPHGRKARCQQAAPSAPAPRPDKAHPRQSGSALARKKCPGQSVCSTGLIPLRPLP